MLAGAGTGSEEQAGRGVDSCTEEEWVEPERTGASYCHSCEGCGYIWFPRFLVEWLL